MKSFYHYNKRITMVSTLSLLLVATISCSEGSRNPSLNLFSSDEVILSRTVLVKQEQEQEQVQNQNSSLMNFNPNLNPYYARNYTDSSTSSEVYLLQDATNAIVEAVRIPSDIAETLNDSNIDEIFENAQRINGHLINVEDSSDSNENENNNEEYNSSNLYQDPSQRFNNPLTNPSKKPYQQIRRAMPSTPLDTDTYYSSNSDDYSYSSSTGFSTKISNDLYVSFTVPDVKAPVVMYPYPNGYRPAPTVGSSHNPNGFIPQGVDPTLSTDNSDITNNDIDIVSILKANLSTECNEEEGCFTFARYNNESALVTNNNNTTTIPILVDNNNNSADNNNGISFSSLEDFNNYFWSISGFSYQTEGCTSEDCSLIVLPNNTFIYSSSSNSSYALYSVQ